MNVLDIIEDINVVRNNAIKFAQGEISQEDLRRSIFELVKNVSRPTNQPIKEIQLSPAEQEWEDAIPIKEVIQTIKEVKSNLDTTKAFFMNDAKRLLYKLEVSADGMALQESHGYAIFVPTKDLNMLTAVDEIVDITGLPWSISETFDEHTIKAINEIGDEVLGMKEVQELIDGESPMEVK